MPRHCQEDYLWKGGKGCPLPTHSSFLGPFPRPSRGGRGVKDVLYPPTRARPHRNVEEPKLKKGVKDHLR